MTNIKYVIEKKLDPSVHTISSSASVTEAISLMANKNIGALIVTEETRVVGILSERDCARKMLKHQFLTEEVQVQQLMTANVLTVALEHSVKDSLKLMTDHHLRHLPVLEQERLVGMVAVGDLIKAVMEDQNALIQQLEYYIDQYGALADATIQDQQKLIQQLQSYES